jgi:hypothetical protein
MRYATVAADYNLPPPEPTPPAIFSVPQKGGGYAYYQSPPGVAPGLGDNWPNPSIAHPNPLGVASITIGRPIPKGSTLIGHGDVAKGSITPLPGAGGNIPGLDASLGSDMGMESPGGRLLGVVAFAVAGYVLVKKFF